MIKANSDKEGCEVKVKGNDTTLCAELTAIMVSMLEDKIINEELLDVAVGLAKAEAKGKRSEYMKKILKEKILDKLKEDETEDDEDEIDEDEKDIDDLLKDIRNVIKEALELEDED